jgi:hypothetical protein
MSNISKLYQSMNSIAMLNCEKIQKIGGKSYIKVNIGHTPVKTVMARSATAACGVM